MRVKNPFNVTIRFEMKLLIIKTLLLFMPLILPYIYQAQRIYMVGLGLTGSVVSHAFKD